MCNKNNINFDKGLSLIKQLEIYAFLEYFTTNVSFALFTIDKCNSGVPKRRITRNNYTEQLQVPRHELV